MKVSFPRELLAPIVLALACIALAPPSYAQSHSQLDKHARKIEKRLAKFQPGTYLDFEFRDRSETYGALDSLSEASFQFIDADTNKTESSLYSDVARVRKAKEYIGQGSETSHRIRLVPVLVGAAAAGAGIAAFEIMH